MKMISDKQQSVRHYTNWANEHWVSIEITSIYGLGPFKTREQANTATEAFFDERQRDGIDS